MEQNETTNPFNMAPIADPYANSSSTPMTPSPKVKPPEDMAADKAESVRLEEETNKLFLNMGLDPDTARKEIVANEKQKLADQYEQDIKKIQEESMQEAMQAGLQEAGQQLYSISGLPIAKGVALGLNSAMASMVDSVSELANAAMMGTTDKKAVKNGPIPLISYKDRLNQYGLSGTEQFVTNITQSLVPAVGAATPGGLAVKTAATAMAAYAMLDPEQQTIGNMLEGTAFEKTAIVGPILQSVKKEDDDTFITGRVKNVAEWIIPDLAAAAVFNAAVKTYFSARRGFQVMNRISEEGAAALRTAEGQRLPIGRGAEAPMAPVQEAVTPPVATAPELPVLNQELIEAATPDLSKAKQLEMPVGGEVTKKEYPITIAGVKGSPEIKINTEALPESKVFTDEKGREIQVSISPKSNVGSFNVEVVHNTPEGQIKIAELPMDMEFQNGKDVIASLNTEYSVEGYQGAGIMREVYGYIRDNVQDFSPSSNQSIGGVGFTKKMVRETAIQQPDMYVQQGLAEAQKRSMVGRREAAPTRQGSFARALGKMPAPTEQQLLEQWNKDVMASNPDALNARISAIDQELMGLGAAEQAVFPGMEVPAAAAKAAPPAPPTGEEIKQLAKELSDTFNPSAQLPLRGERVLDSLVDKYTGKYTGTNDALSNYNRLVEELETALQKLPAATIEHNGKTYNLIPRKTGIYAVEPGKDWYNYASKVDLGFELQRRDGELGSYLVPAFIKNGTYDRDAAGLTLKVLKYIRENVGEVQPSKALLPSGKTFVAKLDDRTTRLMVEQYFPSAEKMALQQFDELEAARIGGEQEAIRVSQLRSEQAALKDRLSVLTEQEWQTDKAAWEPVAGLDTPPVYVNEAGQVAANANNGDLVEAIAAAYDNNPSAFTPRGPQTTPEMAAKAKKLVASPEQVQALLETSAQRPLTAEERIALEFVREKVADDALAKVRKAATTREDLDLIAAKEAVDAMIRLSNKAQGTNSEAGRSLGIIRNLGLLAKTGDEEAIKALGQAGRNKLRNEYIAKYGKDNLESLIKQFDEISRIDDTAFAVKGDEVVRRTKYMRFNDALYSVYVNALLTPRTSVAVLASNTMMGAAKVMDNFFAAKIGAALETKDAFDMVYAKTFQQQLSKNYRDSFQAAYNAASLGRSQYVRFDMTAGAKNVDAIIANSAWEQIAEKGVSFLEKAAYSKIGTAPTRMVMAADTFVAHKIMNADLVARGTSLGIKRGLEKSDLEDFVMAFVRNPDEATLREVTENAQRISMQRDLSKSWLAMGQKTVEKDPTGMLRFLYPFANTKVNLMVTALEYGPASLLLDSTRSAIASGGKARDMALARMATGMTFTTAVAGLVASGTLVLPKEDYKQETALDAEGKGKIGASLIIGGKAYPVSWVDPLGRAMNLIAAAYPSIASSDSQMDREISAIALATVVGYLDDTAYDMFGELNSVLKAAKGKEELSPRISKMLSGTVRFPLEGTLKAVSTTWSPEKGSPITEDDAIVSYFFNRLQNVAGYGLPPQRNILGYSVEEPNGIGAFGPFYASDTKVSPVYENLRKFADYDEKLRRGGYKPLLTIEMPDKELSVSPTPGTAGIKVRLTAQEYDDLIVEATTALQFRGGQMRTLEGALENFFNVEGAMIAKDIDKRIASTIDQEERKRLQETMYMAYGNNIKSIINSYYEQAKQKIATRPNIQARAYEQHKKRLRFKDSPLSGMLTIGE